MTTRILVIKTGALGDVLRTTAILPGLAERHAPLELTWVTAHGARPLVEHHRLVDVTLSVDPGNAAEVASLGEQLGGTRWDRVLSFDDEEPLCALASSLESASLSGAFLRPDGQRAYTDDVAPWFDMGLLSRFGKQEADRLKVVNQKSHPAIYAAMLGIRAGKPELPLPEAERARARAFADEHGLEEHRPLIGLNTGAGGRWRTKELPVERTVDLARRIAASLEGRAGFLVLGGPDERERNARLLEGLAALDPQLAVFDGGSDNNLLQFAALIGLVDLLVVSDSMALHMGIALDRRLVCFFAPTSAAEIELYGLGEKVWSSAPDYCSYRKDADNSSITAELLSEKVLEVLRR